MRTWGFVRGKFSANTTKSCSARAAGGLRTTRSG